MVDSNSSKPRGKPPEEKGIGLAGKNPETKLPLKEHRILVTGPTSQVGMPVALALAQANDVWGIARFSDEMGRKRLEAAGVTCTKSDLATSDFAELPNDFDYLLNFAVARGGDNDWDRDIAINAESIGLLMARLTKVKAVFHCSTMGVYKYQGPRHAFRETDALVGIDHGRIVPTYPYTKIMAEAVVRAAAREHRIPTTIARLAVPYGTSDGWPVSMLLAMQRGIPIPLHADRPNTYSTIHDDDILRTIPRLLAVANVPATIVNWGGASSSIEEWCEIFHELTGLEPKFAESASPVRSVVVDLTRMHELIGPVEVNIREGLRRVVETHRNIPLKEELMRYFLALYGNALGNALQELHTKDTMRWGSSS